MPEPTSTSGNTLRYKRADLPSGLYSVLIPAGTHLWAFDPCSLWAALSREMTTTREVL